MCVDGNCRCERQGRWYRTLVVGLLAIIAAAVVSERSSMLPAATAQIPDTAAQRQAIVEQLQITNQLLDRILMHLETKAVKVRVAGSDEKDGAGSDGTSSRPTVSPFTGSRSR